MLLAALVGLFANAAAFSAGALVRPPSSAVGAHTPPHPLMKLVRKVNTAEFEKEIQDCSTPILVDVMAVWCGPCQLMAPELEKVAQRLEGRCRVLKIDSEEEPDVASTLQIRGLPTILLINDMSIIMRAEGALMADELEKLVEHHAFGGPAPEISDIDRMPA
ncbi:hypothetical protein AB1Y20_002209 [Prymnesium parvum]|uniref:Thioredoxin domain-containing protein n=1 Tax=Prymnesium parvum TaxID=97485 RepID=A0AB34JAL6_PRYPA